jgi:predicted DNA-binding protein (MmcQ/YjbR family)
MNVDSIRAYCLSFPGATEKLQWGDALCFKVNANGKMFAVLGLDHVRLSFKCTPETFAELIERPDIRPSPYLGRYHWVILDRLDAVANDELKDLVRQSYEMVAAKASARKASSPRRTKEKRAKPTASKRITSKPRARKRRRRTKD